MAQTEAWVIGDQWSFLNDAQGALPLQPLPEPIPNGDQDGKKYHGQIASHSQMARADGQGNLLFFAIDGDLYDGEGFLIADHLGAGCAECLYPGIAEFFALRVPGTCDKYYVISASEGAIGGFQTTFFVSVLDLGVDNPTWADPERRGHLIEVPDLFEPPAEYPEFYTWFADLHVSEGYSPSMFRFGSSDEGKPHVTHFGVIDPGWSNGELLLHAVTTDRVYQYRVTANGIYPANGSPWWIQFDPNYIAYKSSSRSVSMGKDALTGELLLGLTDCRLVEDPDDPWSELGEVLVIRISPTTGEWLSQRIYSPFPAGWNDCGGLENPVGPHGCAFTPDGQKLIFTGDAPAPMVGVVDLATEAYTDLIGPLSIPDPSTVMRSRIYVNRSASGTGWSAYMPHGGGVSALVGIENMNTATWQADVPFTAIVDAVPAYVCALDPDDFHIAMLSGQVENDQQATGLTFAPNALCCEYLVEVGAQGLHAFSGNNQSDPWVPGNNDFGNAAGEVYLDQDFVVQPGAQLHVSGMTWRFGPNARLVIKPGGYAKFSNCTLTGYVCDGFRWPGIRVEGHTALDQTPTIGGDQGFLRLISCTVSNARTGVLCATEFPDQSIDVAGYGGIVYCTGSTIKNCIWGADLGEYHANQPNNIEDNLCFFSTTRFVTDAAWPDNALPAVQLFVHGTRKVKVNYCSFANDAPQLFPAEQWGYGVYASNAEVTVQGSANPNYSYVRNLRYGVLRQGFSTTIPTTVDGMRFSGNVYGIFDRFGHFNRYTNNTFSVPDQGTAPSKRVGMYLWQSRFFTVERNTFTGQDPAIEPLENSIGIFFKGISPDQSTDWLYDGERIYDNNFNDLFVGCLVNGIHRSDDGSQEDRGLQIFCGDYSNNVEDIAIGPRSLIMPNQFELGQQVQLAGNRFYGAANCTSEFDWILDDNWNQNVGAYNNMVITYLRNEDPLCAATCPDPATDQFVDLPEPFSGAFIENEDCGQGVLDASHMRPQAESIYQQVRQACASAKSLLDGTTDGGSTVDLIIEIDQQEPWLSSAYLRDRMMLKSPLSNDVLKSMLLRGQPMDPWHITQVCLQNSPLDPGMLGLIAEGTVLNSFFQNVVRQAQVGQGPSAKQLLQQEWMVRRGQLARAYTELGWLWATDTITPGGDDSLLYTIRNLDELDMTWSRMANCLVDGDVTNAIAEMEHFPKGQSGLDALRDVVAMAEAHNGDWSQLGSTERESLLQYAESNVQGAALYASILAAYGIAEVVLEPELPNSHHAMHISGADNDDAQLMTGVTAYPTPCDAEVMLAFPSELNGAEFTVEDAQGRVMFKGRFESAGVHHLSTRDWPSGAYVVLAQRSGLTGRLLIRH